MYIKCKCEAMITSSSMVFSMEEQKLYRALTYICRNKKCTEYEKVIGEEKVEIPVTTE